MAAAERSLGSRSVKSDRTPRTPLPRRHSVGLPCALIRTESQYLISSYRPANAKSELVLLECRPWLTRLIEEIVVRIENVVAKELKDVPVIVVGARLGDDADVCPTIAPVGRIV